MLTKNHSPTRGTPALRNFHPAEDAKLIRILVDAGAIVLEKTTSMNYLSAGPATT